MTGRRHHRNEREPILTIDYFGVGKELIFTYDQTESVNKADSIIMTVKKGRFGFDVIKKYDVIAR
jgi:5,10-methenyltetrahydromethanopterin hydrogenase